MSLSDIYHFLGRDLKAWVSANEKLRGKITAHDLNYLFEFHTDKGLIIDLMRFDKVFYHETFAYRTGDKTIQAFVGKVCMVIHQSLAEQGVADLRIIITVKSRVSFRTLFGDFYIHPHFNSRSVPSLQRNPHDEW